MSCCVCILHSTGICCEPKLLSQAVYGTSAVFHSVRTSSPDFIPTIAILRANPIEGVRYAYTSCSDDAPYDAEIEHATETDSAENGTGSYRSLALCFGGRSAVGFQRAILRCGAQSDESKGLVDNADPWRCLAGALLTACCFLNSRDMSGGKNKDGSSVHPAMQKRGGSIIVFSSVCDDRAISFSTECSFSAATVAAVGLQATIHVFGPGVRLGLMGTRLEAISRSTGGICEPQFALSQVGYVLDGINTGLTLQQHDMAASRKARERLVEQYVIQPVNLPQDPASIFTIDEGNAGYLAWLCPSCMGVMVRHPGENDEVANLCPYCSLAERTTECH